jgi:hypothetical protein
MTGEGVAWTSREIVQAGTEMLYDTFTRSEHPKNKLLHDVLNEIVGSKREINTREVGKALKRYHGRILNGKQLQTEYDKEKKINKWVILTHGKEKQKNEF